MRKRTDSRQMEQSNNNAISMSFVPESSGIIMDIIPNYDERIVYNYLCAIIINRAEDLVLRYIIWGIRYGKMH